MIRCVRPGDLDLVAAIEAACFPPAEAATREALAQRIAAFPDSFLVAELDGALVGMVNGCCTDSPVIFDEMFHGVEHHRPGGANQAIFGLDVLPAHRRQGVAARLMRALIRASREAGRKAVILTCKDPLISYYETLGFVNDGLSQSTHGDARWFDMTLMLRR
ncbi:MAG: GNAT family N-acetyltransferase [Thermodesulfobacteriota bacterium]